MPTIPKPTKADRAKQTKRRKAARREFATTLKPPPPISEEKRKAREHDWHRRATCRAIVLARDGGRCRHSGLFVGPQGEVHELKPRSLGGSPYTPSNCVTLSARSHRRVTEHKLTIEAIDRRKGANGPLRFSDSDVWSYPSNGAALK